MKSSRHCLGILWGSRTWGGCTGQGDTLCSVPTRPGHYVHFDTSVLGPGSTTARLESQHLSAAADSCLRFWYHMDIPEHLCKPCCPWGGHHEPTMGAGGLGQGLQTPSPPMGPWTLRFSSGWAGRVAPSCWVLPSQGRVAWLGGLGGSWGAPWMPRHLSPLHVAGCGELRVTLRGAAGQRTVWSVAGHQSRGWRGGVVPVRSPGEFQVSGAALGCRVPSEGVGCPPQASPPTSHLPLQIIFEITTRRWPMEGTVALDDIVYSTVGGCHSSPEVPVEGEGTILAVKGQPSTAQGAGTEAGAGASSPGW